MAQRPNEADHDLHCRQCISCEPLHELHFLPPKRSILRMRCRRDMSCFSAKSNTLRFCHVLACMRMRVTRYLFPQNHSLGFVSCPCPVAVWNLTVLGISAPGRLSQTSDLTLLM